MCVMSVSSTYVPGVSFEWTESEESSSLSSGYALIGMLVAEIQELEQLERNALQRSTLLQCTSLALVSMFV